MGGNSKYSDNWDFTFLGIFYWSKEQFQTANSLQHKRAQFKHLAKSINLSSEAAQSQKS